VIADNCGFPHYRARAVVDEKMCSDPRARMEIHAGSSVGPFGHDARDERNIFEIEFMCQALHRNCLNERISHDHFFLAQGSGVAVEGCFGISLEQVSDSRKAFDGTPEYRFARWGEDRV
jgi:hypothetical protein